MEKEYDTDWSYPWCTIKHKDGHFENTVDDQIKALDTVRLIHRSNCYVYLPNLSENEGPVRRLKFCNTKLKSDTLVIIIYNESAL